MISLQQEILIHPDYKISLQPAKVKKEYEQLGPGLKTSFSTADLSVHTAFTIVGVHYTYIHIYIHAYIPTYVHTCMHAYIDTYMHRHIHT